MPEKILLCTPSLDRRIDIGTHYGILQIMAAAGGAIQPYSLVGNSDIRNCRNLCAHYFLTRTQCDTLFFLDSDIVFTAEDFAYMLEGEESVVIAPYARKQWGMAPTAFGMGFCRIGRDVFDNLNDWVTEEGEEQLRRYYVTEFGGSSICTDFFTNGATSDARWFGEDTGFWHWCALRGLSVRYEKRTRLNHVGPCLYGYPDQFPPDAMAYQGEALPTNAERPD